MNLVAKSDQSTGNHTYASYVINSGDVTFAFSAPYSLRAVAEVTGPGTPPHPAFNQDDMFDFTKKHGLAVRAVGIVVDDAAKAHAECVAHGMTSVLPPTTLSDASGSMVISEVELYGDVVVRWISTDNYKGPYLPGYEAVDSPPIGFGIERLDHAVGNVRSPDGHPGPGLPHIHASLRLSILMRELTYTFLTLAALGARRGMRCRCR